MLREPTQIGWLPIDAVQPDTKAEAAQPRRAGEPALTGQEPYGDSRRGTPAASCAEAALPRRAGELVLTGQEPYGDSRRGTPAASCAEAALPRRAGELVLTGQEPYGDSRRGTPAASDADESAMAGGRDAVGRSLLGAQSLAPREGRPLLGGLFLPPVPVEALGDGRYRALDGDALLCRYREAGMTQVAAVVRVGSELDERVNALLGELSRGALDCYDEAARCRALMEECGATLPGLALRLGKSQAALRRRLRLLALDEDTRAALRSGGLGEAHALLLLRIQPPSARARLARQTVERRLTVGQLDDLVEGMLRRLPVPAPAEGRVRPAIRDHRLYLNAIRDIVEQMQAAGLQAQMTTAQGASLAEIRITVPLLRGSRA